MSAETAIRPEYIELESTTTTANLRAGSSKEHVPDSGAAPGGSRPAAASAAASTELAWLTWSLFLFPPSSRIRRAAASFVSSRYVLRRAFAALRATSGV